MAEKHVFVGGLGPYNYDNTGVLPTDPTEQLEAINTNGQLHVEEAPTDDNHVLRKGDIASLIRKTVEVANIANPTELVDYSGEADGDMLVAYAASVFTLYAWSTEALTAAAPYVVTGDGGFWVAIGGAYRAGALTVKGVFTLKDTSGNTILASGDDGVTFEDGKTLWADDIVASGNADVTGNASVGGDTALTGALTVGGLLTATGKVVLTRDSQALTADTNTITPTSSFHHLTTVSPLTMASTPTIAAGTRGQILVLTAGSAGGTQVTLQDKSALASSGLWLGAETRALGNTVGGNDAILGLFYDGTYWREIFYVTLQASYA